MAVRNNNNKVPNTFDRSQSIMVHTTWDRLYVKLDPHVQKLRKDRGWEGALGLVVTISITLASADFKSWMGMPADTIRAIFILLLIFSICYFFYTLRNIWNSRKETLKCIVDDVFMNITYGVPDDDSGEISEHENSSE